MGTLRRATYRRAVSTTTAPRGAALPSGEPLIVTHQEIAVAAAADDVHAALWEADLTASRPARMLAAITWAPQRLAARLAGRAAPRSPEARLEAMLAPGGPWVLLEERRRGAVLGLLWSPPAGGTIVAPQDYAAFAQPGYVKVLWSFELVETAGGATTLACETRSYPTSRGARRRLELLWPFIAGPAALLRRLALRAVAAEAERRAAR